MVAYLVIQVLKSERELLALRNSGDAEIEPCPVEVTFQEWC